VADQRSKAEPLSRQALIVSWRAGDAQTVLACLIARHDVLWRPGTGPQRAEVAREIVRVATEAGDEEHLAQGLLLLANAELENGSAGYRAALDSCLQVLDRINQPRHRYLAETRRAAVALLEGELEEADRRISAAAGLGRRICEPDTGNVEMSQRLELIRARGEPNELSAFASEAVGHWVGAPVHAHAVAAGFAARAGDLKRAGTHVVTVLDLGGWRAESSYLWSVLVRELSRAAVKLGDHDLCRRLLDDLMPLAGSCAVNGAVVAFAGNHAHTAALLAAELGRPEADGLFATAEQSYRRLGAYGWLDELKLDRGWSATNADRLEPNGIWRSGKVWHLRYAGRQIVLADAKGLSDLARLLSRPGTDVAALDLMASSIHSSSADPMVDSAALRDYRRRLADLDQEAAEAKARNDHGAAAQVGAEREMLLAELGKITSRTGQPRSFANRPAERARKAVSARIRAAIAQIEQALPELGEHLNSTIVTGSYCRYRGERHWSTGV
jgi:hypothetical protein